MRVWLYRHSLSAHSGAGRLLLAQARALDAMGFDARIAGQRGVLRYWLRSGRRARRIAPEALDRLGAARDTIVVDHDMRLARPAIVFVHNLYTAACRYVERAAWRELAADEAAHLARLDTAVPIVANSHQVADALARHLAVPRARLHVIHPGYDAARFDPRRLPRLRAAARGRLKMTPDAPLVGFVTSGDLEKRGLDLFLDCAEAIARESRNARFLVVGSKRLPDQVLRHPLVAAGRVLHRPRDAYPEHWYAALDVFLYPARYEEFGLVVTEALAMGLPVLTSRRVGAAECLPDAYRQWLLETPDVAQFAAHALALLGNPGERERLAIAGTRHVVDFDQSRYAEKSAALILAQKR